MLVIYNQSQSDYRI